jgi:hypothetical protein
VTSEFHAVVAELETLRPWDPDLTISTVDYQDTYPPGDGPRIEIVFLGQSISTPSAYVPEDELRPRQQFNTWSMLYGIQDGIVEAMWSHGLDPVWPGCLHAHPHPAQIELVGDRVLWVCPTSGEVVRPVLGADSPPP